MVFDKFPTCKAHTSQNSRCKVHQHAPKSNKMINRTNLEDLLDPKKLKAVDQSNEQ